MAISHAIFKLRLLRLPKQSHPLAKSAVKGLTHPHFPKASGKCQMWTRLCYEDAYGLAYELAHKPSAALAGIAFRSAGLAMPPGTAPIEGDILYKLNGSGGFGHVGIVLRGGMRAENSSIHSGDGDARGLRTPEEFGHWDILVRLPRNPPKK